MKKCPFRKSIVHTAGLCTGQGYPTEWISNEDFEKCIKEQCMAFDTEENSENKKISYCKLCK